MASRYHVTKTEAAISLSRLAAAGSPNSPVARFLSCFYALMPFAVFCSFVLGRNARKLFCKIPEAYLLAIKGYATFCEKIRCNLII